MDLLPRRALPPRAGRLLTVDVADSADLKLVRDQLHRCFGAARPEHRAGPDVVQRVALVATELVGNALRHGRPPVTVRLLRDDACYILDVLDQGPQHAPRLTTRQHPTVPGGRGLLIARTLTDDLCWFAEGPAKHVWASFRYR